MNDKTEDGELSDIRVLDSIQRDIWARINDEINARGIKIGAGDAYAIGSVIKEVLHPKVRGYVTTKAEQLVAEGEKVARDSEQNTLFSILRHLHIKHDAKAIMRVRKEWDASATLNKDNKEDS